jgi:hypothetical protein
MNLKHTRFKREFKNQNKPYLFIYESNKLSNHSFKFICQSIYADSDWILYIYWHSLCGSPCYLLFPENFIIDRGNSYKMGGLIWWSLFSLSLAYFFVLYIGADPIGSRGYPWISKLVFFINIFGNLPSPGNLFCPLRLSNYFYWEKIFNIVHNEIIMQRYQNIKLRRRKLSSSTWLSITLSFILLFIFNI